MPLDVIRTGGLAAVKVSLNVLMFVWYSFEANVSAK